MTSFGQQSSRPLTLSRLLSFGNPVTEDSILSSASYALSEIPRRLSRRIRSLENLPFIVGTNPHVSRTLEAYRTSFEWLATYPVVRSLRDNADFATQLEHLVHSHANDIPTMAKGFQECSRYMTPGAVNEFLDTAIRNRISVRLIAEQHIALSHVLSEYGAQGKHDGVVDVNCSPADMVRACSVIVSEMCEATFGASPEVVIDGHVDSTFAYVPVHLQYVLTELLKNAFRATVEKHCRSHSLSSASAMPPVLVTISPPPRVPGIVRPSYMSIRVRDEGGGVSPHNMARVFSYAFSTATRNAEETGGGPYAAQHIGGNAATMEVGDKDDAGLFSEMTDKGIQAGVGTLAGLGYGLPMSRLYARYFGGSLDLFSLDGWGTDAFLKLRCLDEAGDVEI